MAEWSTPPSSNLKFTGRVGSNTSRDKPLFLWARNFTLIAYYWLIPGTYSRVFQYAYNTIKLKQVCINLYIFFFHFYFLHFFHLHSHDKIQPRIIYISTKQFNLSMFTCYFMLATTVSFYGVSFKPPLSSDITWTHRIEK
jgi:hypothetical protein